MLGAVHDEMGGWPPRPGGLDAAMPLVPVEVVRSLTVAGTPEQCVAGARAYETKPNIYPALLPITENYEQMVDVFAPA